MEVVVSSSEMIKPSRPTPHHLRRVQLSFIDELTPRAPGPFTYFYPPSSSTHSSTTTTTLHLLKKSLSETLTRYYPLAGRLRDDSVECNDHGVPYFEARITNTSLMEIVRVRDYVEITKLLPHVDTDDILLAVQVSQFVCGGLAISASFSRKFLDGHSMGTFVTRWAATARGGQHEKTVPKFDLSAVFPPRNYKLMLGPRVKREETRRVVKAFTFSSESVSLLTRKYNAAYPNLGRGLSRTETLTTFIWTRFLVSNHGDDAKEAGKTYRVVQAVELRARANPPLPKDCFGNVSRFALTVPSMEGNEENGYGLVTQMRDAVNQVDGNYVRKLQEGDPNPNNSGAAAATGSAARSSTGTAFSFTSIARVSFYEVDFGFGKPIWVSFYTLYPENLVALMPTRLGDGMEAVVHLKEDQLGKLEADKVFQAYVSPRMASSNVPINSSM